jgi:ABC-type Mn2+/Zn2+ transport system permease subunit
VVASVVTLLASLLLGWLPEPRRLGRDAVIGVAYILASALIIVIGDRIPQGTHDIKDVLYGNAVAVEPGQMVAAVIVSLGVGIVHAVMLRPFLLASYDPDAARAHRVPVRAIDAGLFLTIGLTIAVATKTIGALPSFAFAVLPAAAALRVTHDMRWVLVLAATLAAASAFVGYWVSFVLSLPTGPCMAVITAIFLVLATGIGAIFRR